MDRELPGQRLVPGMASIGLGFAYGVFTVMAVLSFFFVAKFIRETKGMSLEDMQAA